MLLQIFQSDEIERALVRGVENDAWRAAGLERFAPSRRTQAPAVAGLQSGKTEIGYRRAQVVAARKGEFQELPGHQRANRMHAVIVASGIAATVAIETGQGFACALAE